jgi:hypothetical protein
MTREKISRDSCACSAELFLIAVEGTRIFGTMVTLGQRVERDD